MGTYMNLKKLRRDRKIVNIIAIFVLVGFFLRIAFDIYDKTFFYFLLILLAFDIIYAFIKLRCPSCKSFLGLRDKSYCGSCGAKIK